MKNICHQALLLCVSVAVICFAGFVHGPNSGERSHSTEPTAKSTVDDKMAERMERLENRVEVLERILFSTSKLAKMMQSMRSRMPNEH